MPKRIQLFSLLGRFWANRVRNDVVQNVVECAYDQGVRAGGGNVWASVRYAWLELFVHAQTSCCACRGALRPIRGARRTNERDQHLIVIATD